MKWLSFLLLLSFNLQGFAASELSEEFAPLYRLIEVNRENLQNEEKLLTLLEEYREARDLFIADSESKKRASRLVRKAHEVNQEIAVLHLETLFSASLLEEIRLFASLAKKASGGVKSP